VGQRAQLEQEQIEQAQAAQKFQARQQQQSSGAAPPDTSNQQLSPNENLNEDLK